MDELSFNRFSDATRTFFVGQCRQLATRGAQGIVLGCTEIELLIREKDLPDLALFRSAEVS